MNRKIMVIGLMLILSCLGTAQAQDQNNKLDVLYLSDGNVLKGNILKYRPNYSLKFRLSSGKKLNFVISEIDSIGQSSLPRVLQQSVEFRKSGWYNITYLNFMNGTAPWTNDYILGVGVNNTFGRYFNKHLALGVGTGLDYYYINQREILVPLYLEAKFVHEINPIVQQVLMLSGGYSWALDNEQINVNGKEGGWMIHPAVGLLFGSSKYYSWQVDAGVRFQKATFEFPEQWDERNKVTHQMLYKRLTIRLGLMF